MSCAGYVEVAIMKTILNKLKEKLAYFCCVITENI